MTNKEDQGNKPLPPISLFTAFVLAAAVFVIMISFLSAFPRPYATDKAAIESFVNATLSRWQTEYAAAKGLKVGRVDIHFDSRPDCFSKEEGAVIAPVGIDLEKGQEILATAAYPQPVRELRVDGIRCLAWPYPGKCRDDYNYVALCLVKQTRSGNVVFPEVATYKELPPSFAADALARAVELEEHGLEECAVFQDWAHSSAGSGPYTDQFKQIILKISGGLIPENDKKEEDDICDAIRHNRFNVHRAHVAAVMACRENGIPCFGFFGATPEKNHIVGIFSDQTGWVYFDFDHPDKGFFSDPPVLLTQAPLFMEFDAGIHGFWSPVAAAYETSDWGTYPFSSTEWGESRKKEDGTDITLSRTYMLDDLGKP